MPENHLLRLAVCNPGASRHAATLADRLRDVAVEECDNPDALRELLGQCDAGLLVACPCPRLDVVESALAIAKEAGKPFAVVNPDRYLPSRQLIRKQLSGPLGPAGLVRLHRWEPPSDQSTELPEGLLRDIDVTLWLVGRQPDRVFAVEQKAQGGGQYVQVHLGFPGGAMALLDFSNQLPPGDGYESLSVIAAHGAAYADDHQNRQLLYRGGHPQAVRTPEDVGHLAGLVLGFIEAIRADRDVTTTSAKEWQTVFAVVDAVRKSLASGQATTL